MIKNQYSPIIISGPSGAGKTKLVEFIEKQNPIFLEAVGLTTRKKRENEVEKMNFITKEEFEALINQDKLIEYCIYNNNYYGMCKEELEKLKYYNLIFNVGYSSAKIIKEMYGNSYMIYLLPPNKEELLKRLGNRDYNRYELGIIETIQHALKYDYLLISLTDNLEKTYFDFMEIIEEKSKSQQKRLTLSKNKDFVNNFYK